MPIASGTEQAWSVDPFAGVIKDGFVWGRGTLDDKGNILAQLEAVEMLIANGFKPKQTVYLAFGEDEELGGNRGNKALVELLKSRGVKLGFVLDEGMVITEGVFPGLSQPLALIGLAEKGGVNVHLSFDGKPGHSSMPTVPSAIGSMSKALASLETHQMPAAIKGVAGDMFGALAPEMPWLNRVLLSNLWLTGPVVQSQLEKSPAANAMMRTTTALTIVNAGNKENVLPGRAEAMPLRNNAHHVSGRPLRDAFEGLAKVQFGMGCFWGAERKFWSIPGVETTAVGYAGGYTPNPTYQEVCSGQTGHTEMVLVVYDPAQVSYGELLKTFWEAHDPTQGMRQGNDIGSQYRSAIYCYGAEQRAQADATREQFQVRSFANAREVLDPRWD